SDGVVTINMSKEFQKVMEQADGGAAAVKALVLTCSQFEGVKEVKLQVEGKDFQLDSETMAASTVVNSEAEALMASALVD
ncbi:MAG: GerMN domain-containing protein, partial [Candidatus Spyradocola sp.]